RHLATVIILLSVRDALPIWPAVGSAERGGPGSPDARGAAAGGGPAVRGEARQLPFQPDGAGQQRVGGRVRADHVAAVAAVDVPRSEEHTSVLQSREKIVCRL